ncbi:MAG: hypothetical protein HC838_06415 [Spirulinaceae cyanobacterium RM2_2_10]|nr:hypothetical protein [Spirulinaceae cyanobacterium RM2_2_10]
MAIAPVEGLLGEAKRLANEVAARAPIAVRMAREAVRYGAETTVRDGLEVERRNFTCCLTPRIRKRVCRRLSRSERRSIGEDERVNG